jgi:hypothetical protein
MTRPVSIGVVLALAGLAAWLLPFCREQRHLYFRDYAYTKEEARRLDRHADILYAHGWRAENRMDRPAAEDLYRRAVSRNALHMGAWLRLAELTAADGDLVGARRITAFCNQYIAPVLRWKWPHTLLAQSLGMEKILTANINYLVARRTKLTDALNLLETHCQGRPAAALAILEPENHPAYLQWAIRWKRLDAARAAWHALPPGQRADSELLSDYVHFLLAKEQFREAAAVWREETGIEGVTNGGFEEETTRKGFDWRMGKDRSGHWDLRRDPGAGRKGGAALRVRFDGQANVSFHHLSQVVAVTPETPCRIRFWWRDKGLTTDQLPFVEVFGYRTKGLYVRGPMLEDARQWRQMEIAFTPPAGCYAVMVRLRRKPSDRFDNKIRGSLWLDDVELQTDAGAPVRPVAAK